MFQRIENFDNAKEFLLLNAPFYTLSSLRISNWKIISHKIKQLHHVLKTMRIFAWSLYLQKLVSVVAIRRFIFNFLQIKTLVDIERPSCYANGSLSASSKISFHGLPSKSKRPSIRKHSIVVIITVNSISFYETAIYREIFSKYFLASIFEKF